MTQRRLTAYPADDHDHHDDLNNLGLQADAGMLLRPPLDRRRVLGLGLLGGIGLLLGCGAVANGTGTVGAGSGGTDACPAAIPSETAGPYPADGSAASGQSLNVLTRFGHRPARPADQLGHRQRGHGRSADAEPEAGERQRQLRGAVGLRGIRVALYGRR